MTNTFPGRLAMFALLLLAPLAWAVEPPVRKTVVDIRGQAFLINGEPTYKGRTYDGAKVEGLLMNSRMVQGIFDDLNPETRGMWKYPDGSDFDAERNTNDFLAAMPAWRRHGLLSFTINLQGGSPQGYSKAQPWENSRSRRRESFGRRTSRGSSGSWTKPTSWGWRPSSGFCTSARRRD